MKVELINFKNSYKENEYLFDDDNRSSQMVLKVRTRDGWRTMDSPYDPVKEARESLGSGAVFCKRVLMIGGGSGYFIQELLKKGVQDIMLITPYRVIADQNAGFARKYARPGVKVFVIVADVFDRKIKDLARAFLTGDAETKVIIHPRESRTCSNIFNPLSVYVSSLQKQVKCLSNRREIKRVLFPGSGQIIEKEMIQAFQKSGAEVSAVAACSDKYIRPEQVMSFLSEFKPDLVVSTNNKGSDREGFIPSACVNAGVRWATWFLDDPRFMVSKTEVEKEQQRYGFCWDYSGIKALGEIGFKHVMPLPLATDPELFSPGAGDPDLAGRIVYVGSPGFGNENKYFSGLNQKKEADTLCEYFETQILSNRRLPSADEMQKAVQELKFQKIFHPGELMRLPAYVMYRANLNYRVRALHELADLKPVVFGSGWEGLLPPQVELRPYVDYYRELPRVYRSDAVHLSLTHLQMYHYPNQRVFDAGACGRTVLGDRVCGWDELFDPGLEGLVFNDFEAMKEKAFLLLKDNNLRCDYGRSLRQQVLARHTYQHRIRTMTDVLTKDGYDY